MGWLITAETANHVPVVSAMMIIIARHITRMGATPNAGAPNAKGALNCSHAASPTCVKLVMPNAAAIAVPATRPSNTDRLPMTPLKVA